MNKRIIICCDGTWNSPGKNYTNVVKLVRAITPVDHEGRHQVVFYDHGVGTNGYMDRILGGAFGIGVKRNVLDSYRFLVHNYQPGDDLYLFGFSRGAYTARALSGMLHAVGLIEKSQLDTLKSLYRYYRTPPKNRPKRGYENNLRPDIKMIGVWDTVGALGVPTPGLRRLTRRFVGFYNTQLSPEVKNARHALAIDEQRGPFKPDLWTGQLLSDQSVRQEWFAGVHSDIGGGYKEQGLSDVALQWMIGEAQSLDLSFDQDMLSDPKFINPDFTAPIHDSYRLGYRLLERLRVKRHVRPVCPKTDEKLPTEERPINESIHESVGKKMRDVPTYHPTNVDEKDLVDDRRNQPRQPTQVKEGQVDVRDHSLPCKVLDFSTLGGARIEVNGVTELNENDPVTISSKHFPKTVGTVAWKNDTHCGIRFAS